MAKSSSTKSQSDKFKEAARELGADTDEGRSTVRWLRLRL